MEQRAELFVAVVPSRRVSADDFVSVLARNDVLMRPVGWGCGHLRDSIGNRYYIRKLMLASIRSVDLRRVRTHSRLCGVIVTPLDNPPSYMV